MFVWVWVWVWACLLAGVYADFLGWIPEWMILRVEI